MKWEEFENSIRESLDEDGVSLDDIDVEIEDCDGDSYNGKKYHTYSISISYESKAVKEAEEKKKKYNAELAELNKKYAV